MMNLSFLFWVLLLVDDVSAVDEVKTVSVMVGDSVTLYINDTETEKADELLWKVHGEKKFIAQFDRDTNKVSFNGKERFEGRLQLDEKTGSLTIKNTRTTDSGVYQLEINTNSDIMKKIFNVTVSDAVKNVSVIEGDTVILKTGVTKILIADLNGTTGSKNLNDETGEITIRNIRRNQTGDYTVKINTSSRILHKKYCINVGEMKTVSVIEGEPIILLTGLIEKRGYDLILWTFGDHLIAEINKENNRLLPHDSAGGKFEGRLQPNEQSLTISDSKTTDSGVYHLNMSSSSHSLQRSIRVTVKISDKPTPDPGLSSGTIPWIVVVVLLLVFIVAGVIYHRRKISELKGRRDVA